MRRWVGLSLGLALGLALAYLGAVRWDRWPARVARSTIQLRDESPIGMLGPLALSWPVDEAAPSPSSFTFDEQIGVEISTEGELLLLAPASPLTPGQHSLRYQPAEGQVSQWEFRVRQPDPLYLIEASGQRSLYRWRSGDPLRLSGDQLVTDYAPSRTGDLVAFAASNPDGGTDIWLVDRQGQDIRKLVDCGEDHCGQIDWSPRGDRLAFSRRSAGGAGQPRLWTVGVEAEAAAPLFQDEARLGEDPTWSPDGRYLAFYDPAAHGVRLLDIDTVREEVVPNRTGVSGSWSADSQRLYLPLLVFQGEEPVTYLYRLQVAQRDLQQLLGEGDGWRQVGEPALGLAGQWMALAAKRGSAGAGLGLYLVDLQDGAVRTLAEDTTYSYGGPSFDASGQQLLFQRFPVGQSQAAPDVLLWRVGQAEPTVLIEGAGSADWLH